MVLRGVWVTVLVDEDLESDESTELRVIDWHLSPFNLVGARSNLALAL
jgi:hypothetical protein